MKHPLRLEKQVKPRPSNTVKWHLPKDLVERLDRRVDRANKLNPRGGRQSRSRLLQELVSELDLRSFKVVELSDVPMVRQSCSLYLPADFVALMESEAKRCHVPIHQFVGALLVKVLR